MKSLSLLYVPLNICAVRYYIKILKCKEIFVAVFRYGFYGSFKIKKNQKQKNNEFLYVKSHMCKDFIIHSLQLCKAYGMTDQAYRIILPIILVVLS